MPLSMRLVMMLSSFGACVMAGTVRQAYPDIGWLQPLFAYLGGFMAAVAIFIRWPQSSASGQ